MVYAGSRSSWAGWESLDRICEFRLKDAGFSTVKRLCVSEQNTKTKSKRTNNQNPSTTYWQLRMYHCILTSHSDALENAFRKQLRDCLVIRWLRLHASHAGSTPGQGVGFHMLFGVPKRKNQYHCLELEEYLNYSFVNSHIINLTSGSATKKQPRI